LILAFSFALAVLAVIPQRSEGICCSHLLILALATARSCYFSPLLLLAPVTALALAFAVASEVGPGFSPDTTRIQKHGFSRWDNLWCSRPSTA
jgi:hypothetical protein